MKEHKSVFEKHQIKVLLIITSVLIVVSIFVAEKFIVEPVSYEKSRYKTKRYILLKEYRLNMRSNIKPRPVYLKDRDSLPNRKYLFRTNNNAFIKPSKIHKNPDRKIVFLGGSTTETYFVDEYKRFPYLVGRLLEKKTGYKINSYNSGVSGNNSIHSLNILLNKIIPLHPDVVVMMHNINDLNILLLENDYWNDNKYKAPIQTVKLNIENKHREVSFTNLFITFLDYLIPNITNAANITYYKYFGKTKKHDEFEHVRGTSVQINKKYILGKFKKNLRAFIKICKVYNIKPMLMTQASRLKNKPDDIIKKRFLKVNKDFNISYDSYRNIYNLLNENVIKIAKEENIEVIDLAKLVPQESKYIYDLVHYNSVGSEYVSNIIANIIKLD